jgi:hypothetical protein
MEVRSSVPLVTSAGNNSDKVKENFKSLSDVFQKYVTGPMKAHPYLSVTVVGVVLLTTAVVIYKDKIEDRFLKFIGSGYPMCVFVGIGLWFTPWAT